LTYINITYCQLLGNIAETVESRYHIIKLTEQKTLCKDAFCPINGKLLVDPILADDDIIYDRHGFLEYIKGREVIKSPVKGITMSSMFRSLLTTRKKIFNMISEM